MAMDEVPSLVTGDKEDETNSPVALHRLAGQGNPGVCLPSTGVSSKGEQLRLSQAWPSRRTLQVNVDRH